MGENPDIEQRMDALLAESHAMLSAAEAGEWDDLIEREAKRRPALEQFFESLSEPAKQQYAEQLRALIGQLLELDQQVMTLSAKAKIDAANEIHNLKAGSEAVKSYTETQR